jgi:hypothetical protein
VKICRKCYSLSHKLLKKSLRLSFQEIGMCEVIFDCILHNAESAVYVNEDDTYL